MRNLTLPAIALLFAACSGADDTNDNFSDLQNLDEKSDAFSAKMKVIGTLSFGDQTDQVKYSGTPKYRGYKFNAQVGDEVTVDVRSPDGEVYAWILDNTYSIVGKATGVDRCLKADCENDAQVTVTLDSSVKSGTFWVVYRTRGEAAAHVSVQLEGVSKGGDFYSCNRDSDCVATPRNECCGTGWMEAVNKNEVKAYHDSFNEVCTQKVCPLYVILDTRQPECNVATHQCQMVAISDIRCGGFTANPHACPADYVCTYNNVPDVPGTCQQKPQCVDNVLCAMGYHWDSTACKCVK